MDDVIRLFKTLADPTRLRLLRLLSRDELTVGEIAEVTALAQSRVSNHLRILREEGLVSERHEGASHYYSQATPYPQHAAGLHSLLEARWNEPGFYPEDLDRLPGVKRARRSRRDAYIAQIASQWDNLRQDLFGDAIAREILRALLPPGLVVVDIGTGTGYVPELFAGRAARVVGVDPSSDMLSVARSKAMRLGIEGLEYVQGSAEEPPVPPAIADVVTLAMVLHYIEAPQVAIAAAARLLKPGGMLMVADFVEHSHQWLQERQAHLWLGFRHERVLEWATTAGLEARSVITLPGRSFTDSDGNRLQVPDAFLMTAARPSIAHGQ